MSEYLLTDLPRYVKTAPRGNFANSVVKEGAVLLFSEDGETLVAKHPDGTFSEIGSGSSGGGNLEVGVLVDDGGTLKIRKRPASPMVRVDQEEIFSKGEMCKR